MARKDYNKFIKEFYSNRDEYKVISIENEPNYNLAYAKVINTNTLLKRKLKTTYNSGVFVDIFPLDNIPSKNIKSFYRKQKILNEMLMLKNMVYKKRKFIKQLCINIGRILIFPFSTKFLIKKITKNVRLN